MSKVIASENLVTNRRHRGKWGAKVDSVREALDVIENGIKGMGDEDGKLVGPFEDPLPKIGEACRVPNKEVTSETVQITAKLFMRKNDQQMAIEAVNKVKQMLNTDRIHNLYVTVPADYEDKIGMTVRSESEAEMESGNESAPSANGQPGDDGKALDPEREGYALEMAKLWNDLSSVEGVEALGLCDVETDVCKRIYQEATIKPKNIQVNLKTCCVVPPALKQFAADEGIKLLTHSDSPEILGDEFCHKVSNMATGAEGKGQTEPQWIIRFQIFKEMRGLLEDRRYIVALEKF